MICREVCIVALLVMGSGLIRAADPASPAAGPFDSLIKNSPFGQAPIPGSQPGGDGSVLEFRGVFVDKGEPYFSLHEPATRMSQWVGLKESGQPYIVESYDIEKGSIQVKYRNQGVTLALKRSQVIVQAMPVFAPATTNIAAAGPPAIAATPASTDEATRMAQVAEEIRRRRALRAPPAPVSQSSAAPAINPPRSTTPSSRP